MGTPLNWNRASLIKIRYYPINKGKPSNRRKYYEDQLSDKIKKQQFFEDILKRLRKMNDARKVEL